MMPQGDPAPNQDRAPTDGLVRNFAAIEFIALRELTSTEYKLYGYYREIEYRTGKPCTQTTRDTADGAGLSLGAISNARRALADKGYVQLAPVYETGTKRQIAVAVTPTPQWFRNAAMIERERRSSNERTGSHAPSPAAGDRSLNEHTREISSGDRSLDEHTRRAADNSPAAESEDRSLDEHSPARHRSSNERSVHLMNTSIYIRSKTQKKKRKDSASSPIGDNADALSPRLFAEGQTAYYVQEHDGVPDVLECTIDRLTPKMVVIRLADGSTKTVKESSLTPERPALARNTTPVQDVIAECSLGIGPEQAIGKNTARRVNAIVGELQRVLAGRMPDADELRAAYAHHAKKGLTPSSKPELVVAMVNRYRDEKGKRSNGNTRGAPDEDARKYPGGIKPLFDRDPETLPATRRYRELKRQAAEAEQRGVRPGGELHPAGAARPPERL